MVGKGTREAEVVGLNPGNGGKNRATCDASAVGKRKYFLFLFTLEIFILTRKRMIPHHLCVGIGDGLRLP